MKLNFLTWRGLRAFTPSVCCLVDQALQWSRETTVNTCLKVSEHRAQIEGKTDVIRNTERKAGEEDKTTAPRG